MKIATIFLIIFQLGHLVGQSKEKLLLKNLINNAVPE